MLLTVVRGVSRFRANDNRKHFFGPTRQVLTGLPPELVGVDPCFYPLLGDPRNNLRPPRLDGSVLRYRSVLETAMLTSAPPAMHQIVDVRADCPSREIPLRLYRPEARFELPIIMFIHGGGFVIGSLETHDGICRALANASGAVVVAVDYRKAPETVFPGAFEDCCAALDWIVSKSASLQIDASRLALCGDSAGGNLAISTALYAYTRGMALRHLALAYPAIDPAMQSESSRLFASNCILTRAFIGWFWDSYLGRPYDARDPAMNVMEASLSDLPPISIATAEFDPLRDEGEAFARAAAGAGIKVVARRYLGMIHGFLSMSDMTPVADRAVRDLADDLRNNLQAT